MLFKIVMSNLFFLFVAPFPVFSKGSDIWNKDFSYIIEAFILMNGVTNAQMTDCQD